MKAAGEWDEAYLLELIRLGEQESLRLDYKASAALTKNDKDKNELSKDVSAFANSAGGLLVYGVLEDKHVPTGIDVGVDRNIITKEWLESVIKSRIFPTVDEFIVKQIALPTKGKDVVVYVVEISAATSRAPHQAYDKRYYKRFNFESTPMEDYEVRDLMRRSLEHNRMFGAAWDLKVETDRLAAAINERGQMDGSYHFYRDRLKIDVSNTLRSSGEVMVLLPKNIQADAADLINQIDEFNSVIELTDPGQNEKARLTDERKRELTDMFQVALRLSRAVGDLLETQP